jgi:hypothetical protein
MSKLAAAALYNCNTHLLSKVALTECDYHTAVSSESVLLHTILYISREHICFTLSGVKMCALSQCYTLVLCMHSLSQQPQDCVTALQHTSN